MNNHEKALQMAQKSIEIITNQNKVYSFNLENFVENLDDPLIITLAAGYYNKAVELEHLNNRKKLKREYALMAFSSIQNALKILKFIKNSKNLELVQEIIKFSEKLQLVGTVCTSSRGSSRKTQRRIFSPPNYNALKDTGFNQLQKFLEGSPKSSDGMTNSHYYSK